MTIFPLWSALFLALIALGNGNESFDVLPDEFYLDIDEVSVSTGYFHTCAIELRSGIDFGGPLKCWGQNRRGEASPPPGIFVQVSCGYFFSCAVGLDETISCWGQTDIAPVQGLFTQVSSGQTHACGLLKDRSIKCWGRNDFGESDPPIGHFVQVSCGQANSCGLRPNGIVECWGKNNHGQSMPPTDIQFKQISVGINHHVCGIMLDGNVRCWGDNSRGQSEFRQGPFLQVSVGVRCTCAIRSDYTIECWGQSTLPVPGTDDASIAKRDANDHSSLTEYEQFDQISLGKEHACAINMESELNCWHSGPDVGGHVVPLGLFVA